MRDGILIDASMDGTKAMTVIFIRFVFLVYRLKTKQTPSAEVQHSPRSSSTGEGRTDAG